MQASAIKKQPLGIHLGTHVIGLLETIVLDDVNLSYCEVVGSSLLSNQKNTNKHLSYLANKIAYDQEKYSKKVVTFCVSTCTLSGTLQSEEMTMATQRVEGRRSKMTKQKYKFLSLTKLCYSVAEVAELLGQSESTIRRLIDKGEIGVVYPTSEMRVTARAIVNYLNVIEEKGAVTRRQRRIAHRKVVR